MLSLSANFDNIGKTIIILLMLSGKVGILAFALTLFANQKNVKIDYEAKILV